MGMQYNPAAINVQQATAPNLQNYQMGPAERVNSTNYMTPEMRAAQSGYDPRLQNYQMGSSRDVNASNYTTPEMRAAQTGYAPELKTFQMGPAERVNAQGVNVGDINAAQMGPAQQVSSQGITAANINAAQMGPAERVGTQSFAQPGSADQYMSPYMQNVVDVQKREAQRQSGIQGTQQQAQAAQAGAFGGGRDAIMRAERERNLGQQMGDIQAQGSQAAFQNAQQQFNAEQQARLAAQQSNQQAGLTTGMQNLNADQQSRVQNAANQMQAQGMNSQQAMQAALANQQAGLTVGSQNLNTQQQTNVQNAANRLQASGMNAQQAMQAALANQQSSLSVGQQNLASQMGTQQLGTQTGTQTALANLSNQQQQQVQNQAAQLQNQGMSAQQAMQAALANQQKDLSTNQQNLSANLGVQQLGTQTGTQVALANLSNQQQQQVQNQAAQLQNQGLSAQQAMQAALANQQAGLTVGQQNLSANLGIQQLGSGQNMQAQLANQQAMAQAQQLQAQQQQFGANYRMQGIQAGMQGANQLAGIGGQKLQAQQNIYGLQNQYGAQQQALEQQKLNQAQQDYANAQQYPMMQLGSMSNMLRGLPMQASTSQMYQAQPNALTQGIGAAGSMASLYNAYNAKPGGAAGGLPNEFKYAKGGIASIPRYDVGGQVMSQLQQMDDQSLARQAKESSSPEIKRMAQAILKQRQAGMNMENAPQPQQDMGMAGGGIIAFANRGEVDEAEAARYKKQTEMYILAAQQAAAERQNLVAAPPAPSAPSAPPAPPAPPVAELPYADSEKLPLEQRITNTLDRVRSKTDPAFVPRSAAASNDTTAVLNENEFPPAGITSAASKATRLSSRAAEFAAMNNYKASPKTSPAAAPKAGPAAAPTDKSIMAAAAKFPAQSGTPGGMAQQNPAPTAGMDTAPSVDAMAAPQVDPYAGAGVALSKAQAEASKTTKQLYDEDLVAKKALGLDQNEAQREYMKSVMAQKSNIAEDAEQKKYLRMAEFFASWGSTPGNTLVAGMTALKAKIPDLITDVKERRKAEADANKVIYELGQAQRQEKLGNWDKAETKKIEAAKLAGRLQENLTTATTNIESQKISSAGQLAVAKTNKAGSLEVANVQADSNRYTADANTRIAELREQSAVLDRLANRTNADENKKFGQYQAASEQERRTLERIATEENGDQYKADIRTVTAMKDENGKVLAGMEPRVAEAQGRIDARKTEWNARITTAKKNTDLAYSRVKVTEPAAGGDASPSVTTTMTRADVEATAKASGKSVAQVEAAAAAKGIKIK